MTRRKVKEKAQKALTWIQRLLQFPVNFNSKHSNPKLLAVEATESSRRQGALKLPTHPQKVTQQQQLNLKVRGFSTPLVSVLVNSWLGTVQSLLWPVLGWNRGSKRLHPVHRDTQLRDNPTSKQLSQGHQQGKSSLPNPRSPLRPSRVQKNLPPSVTLRDNQQAVENPRPSAGVPQAGSLGIESKG